MKQTLLILAAFFLLSSASAQRKQLREFTNDFSGDGATFRIGLSFIPLRIASWFVPKSAFDGDAAEIKLALKKVKSVKLYTIHMPKGQAIPRESVDLLKEELKKAQDFETLVEVKHKGANVFLLSDGRGNERLDNLVVLVQEDTEMVMAHLRTKLTVNDVSRIINGIQNREKEREAVASGMVAKQ
ncbi:DUF4252 domain-containing protein [Chitinophaga sp.]|uniref:DUF4252 domain-containing protein n=1 Tax=Chitinophaga sp. TaxID=1869181 RepID=UPI0031DC1D7D